MKALKILAFFIVLYALILMVTFSFQTKLIFFPERLPEHFQFDKEIGGEEVFINTADNQKINGLFFGGTNNETTERWLKLSHIFLISY